MTNANYLFDPAVIKGQVNGKWYYSYDRKHYEPVMPRFHLIDVFSEGLAAVCSYSDWGYISLDGEIVIPLQYAGCGAFKHGAAIVKERQNSRLMYALINKAGTRLTPWVDFLGSSVSKEGYRRIQVGNKWGFVDSNGNIVLNPQYDACCDFSEGLAAVEVNKQWGYVNSAGKWVISPKYKEAGCFDDGVARVLRNEKWAHINKRGREVMYEAPPKDKADYWRFNRPTPSVTYEELYDNGRWGVMDNKGNIIVSPQFDKAEMLYENIVGVEWHKGWDIVYLDALNGEHTVTPAGILK